MYVPLDENDRISRFLCESYDSSSMCAKYCIMQGSPTFCTYVRLMDYISSQAHMLQTSSLCSSRTARIKKKPAISVIIFAMVSVQRNSLWSSSNGMNFSSESSNTNRSVSPIGPVPSSSVRLWFPNVAATVKPESSSIGTYSLFSTPKSPYQVPNPPVGTRGVYTRSPLLAVPSDPLDSVLGTFPCARLFGLPMDASVEDVLVFFHGFVVLDIVVVPHPYNGPGEAFVLFSNLADFQIALQR